MTYLYFDAKAGLSGDMILGALLDLGIVSPARFKAAMAGLKLPVRISIAPAERSHMRGLRVEVAVREPGSKPRRFRDVRALVRRAPVTAAVRDRAEAIFRNLFEAEARVHGEPLDRVHLHEAGADDALIDVVGASWLVEELGAGEIYASPLNVGDGFVKTAHGVLPVPPPAVAELLKGVPVYAAHARQELVTPTGAAIIKTLARAYLRLPELTYLRIGCGAGGRDLPGFPNILRVFYGDRERLDPGKRVFLVEATIDDSNPQLLAAFLDRALELGALDAGLSPVVMKKNRLGTKLSILAEQAGLDGLIEAVFRETSSIGVRYFPVERRALERTVRPVRVLGEPVAVKVSLLDGRPVNVQPEFEDCRRIARRRGLALKEVLRLAALAYGKTGKG